MTTSRSYLARFDPLGDKHPSQCCSLRHVATSPLWAKLEVPGGGFKPHLCRDNHIFVSPARLKWGRRAGGLIIV